MNDLDDRDIYQRLDPSGMRHRLRGLPNQFRQVPGAVAQASIPGDFASVRHVVVAGMGGSAIGGDLVADLAHLGLAPPITTWRDYDMPAFVDQQTLVLACSYSGETEETLSAFRRAIAQKAKVVVLTSGGALRREAQEAGAPVIPIDYEGEPRCAIGYSFLGPLLAMAALGLVPSQSDPLAEAINALEELVPIIAEDSPQVDNSAKQLASELAGRLPVVYGGGIFIGLARRWKTQFNENAKVWAFTDLLPEAHHNSVVGYQLPEGTRSQAFVLLLRPQPLHPRLALRYRITTDLLQGAQIPFRIVEGQGSSPLSQTLTALVVGDYTSYYLALLQGVDPSPVTAIDSVRRRLAEG